MPPFGVGGIEEPVEISEFMWGCSWGCIEGTLIRLGISWGCVVSLGAARWGLVQIGLVEVETNTHNKSNKDSMPDRLV